jgi:hypothetical protein
MAVATTTAKMVRVGPIASIAGTAMSVALRLQRPAAASGLNDGATEERANPARGELMT